MDEEFAHIQVPVLRLANGDITCKKDGKQCPFLLSSDIYPDAYTCCFLQPKFKEGPRPDLSEDLDSGWLIPHNNCPIKDQPEKTYA